MIDPILQEIHEVRRKHWEEAGGTREGLRAYYERFAKEFREKGPDALLQERLEALAREKADRRPPQPPRKRKAPARGKTVARKGATKA